MELASNKKFSLAGLCSGSLMVFGTTVGAGMLGIPLVTAKAGFLPAAMVTCLVWIFMAITGLLFLEVSLKMPDGANLISMSRRFLGKKGVWISGALFLFLYYCLLIAYFAGGAPLLGQFLSVIGIPLPPVAQTVVFAVAFGWIVAAGSRWISRTNAVLSCGMLGVYAVLVILGCQTVEIERLEPARFSAAAFAVPVLFGAFGFHNVIPSLTTYLKKEKKTLRSSVVIGTFLAFALYLVWQWLILGSLPLSVLEETLQKGLPVTYALQASSEGLSIYVLGQIFAFLALTTSFLGVSFSLVDFLQDGFRRGGRVMNRFFCVLFSLIPPLVCVLLDPSIFDRALGLAGGFGEAILNGLLPVVLFVNMRALSGAVPLSLKGKGGLALLVLFSLFVFFSEAYYLIA